MQYLTADAAQGICPEGWHIPTGHEFKVLEQFSNDEAKKLLAIGESDDANNETGFSALFAGRRGDVNGTFSEIDELTYFYSSSKSSLSSYKYNLKLDKFSSGITINAKIETNGLSVRCIKGENANTYSEPCPEIPTLTYQGKTYNTVQIGEQCWLKENLNVGTRIPSSTAQSNNGAVEKYCYDNDETNCDIYGGLYQWNEAMEYASQEGAQGICPTGWHIPTRNELGSLMSAVFLDGNALKAVGQGSGEGVGIDARGFSALLTGQYWYDNNFAWLGDKTYFWSSSEMSTDAARYIIVNGDDNKIISTSMPKNLSGISIRCLKD